MGINLPGTNPYAFMDQDSVSKQRWLDTVSRPFSASSQISGGRTVGGPLPDRAWDAFFGALQRSNAKVDFAGRQGDGFGRLMAKDEMTGKTYDMDAGQVAPGLGGPADGPSTGPAAAPLRGLRAAIGGRRR